MNEIGTGCGSCSYCVDGQCTYENKCSGSYSYTTNNIDARAICTPLSPTNPNVVYVNSPIEISKPNMGIGINPHPVSHITYSDIRWHYANSELPKEYKMILYKTKNSDYFIGTYYSNIFCGDESYRPEEVYKWAYIEPYKEGDK